MSRFGFSTEPAVGGDFTGIIKYDARAGRVFRVDREQTGDGFASNPVDITATFKAVVDFENVETGWMDFPPGSAPSFALVQLSSLDKGGSLPDRPSAKHKSGIRFLLKLNKTCGGDKPVRELAGTSKAFLQGVEEVYTEYEKQKAQYPGQLPVIELASTTPVKSGSGAQQSTNYRPTFRITGWAQRPADLIYLRPSTAPVEPLKPTPPATGAQTVPPPNVMNNGFGRGQPAQMADDDFG
jgi:hypothetical protein